MTTTSLVDLVPALKRLLAVPGAFAAEFPTTTDTELALLLADALGEAQMDTLLSGFTEVAGVVTPDMTAAERSIVLLYANARVIVAELRNRKTHVRYEAGGAVFEEDQAASLLVEQLRMLQVSKRQMLLNLQQGGADLFYMVDAYSMRAQAAGKSWEERTIDAIATQIH